MGPRPRVVLVGQRSTLPSVFDSATAAGIDLILVPRDDEPVDPAALPGCVVDCVPLDVYGDPDGAIDTLAAMHRREPLAGIISGCDPAVPFVARAAARLGLPGIAEEAAHNVRDKRRLRTVLRAAGLNTPGFVALDEPSPEAVAKAAVELEFPVVVKPAHGYASFGVIRVDQPDDLAATVARVWRACRDELGYGVDDGRPQGLLVEEYLDGPEFAIESLVHDGEVKVYTINDKGEPTGPYFEEICYRAPAQLSPDVVAAIVDEVSAAHEALGVTVGATHTELRLRHGRRPYLLEMGARMGGGGLTHHMVWASTGRDYAGDALRVVAGQQPADWHLPIDSPTAAGCYIVPCQGHGRIVSITGLDELRADPRVRHVIQLLHEGDVVGPFPEWWGYPAFVLSKHDSYPDLVAFHQHLDSSIVIRYAPAERDVAGS